jgi:2-oxoglutarate dehydrogenase E2 component (dihydrolipoamide succinyltransferase)
MSKFQLLLPRMGESIEEATIINWLKNEGDEIYIDDLVVEIATDKVDSEVPSDVSGILIKKLCKVNDVVKVGEPIAVIEIENSLEASSETKPVLKSEKPENEVQKIIYKANKIIESPKNYSTKKKLFPIN